VRWQDAPQLGAAVVLSFSRKGYSEAVMRQDTESFLRCLENALRHFWRRGAAHLAFTPRRRP
jgi:hypothetical protein